MPSPRHFPPWSVHSEGEHPGQQGLGPLGARCFMRTNRTPDQWHNWCLARNRIDKELREHYRACTTGELPPQLLALSKQLAALIKTVEEGGDDDDEITEDEAIAILRDTGLDAEIPSVREWFAWERSQKRPQ